MAKDSAITSIVNLPAAFFGVVLAVLILTGTAIAETPDVKLNSEVETARELLNTWSGQPEVLEQARSTLGQVLNADPKNYEALKEMARYQIMSGYINSTWKKFGTHLYEVGTYRPGTLERAEAAVQEAIRINQGFAGGYVLLGHIKFEQSQFNEAEKALTQAEAIGTDDPWLQLNWATLEKSRGQYPAAEVRWQRVVQSNTTNIKAKASAYKFLIDSRIRAGDHDVAVALYRDQIAFNPTNAWMRGNFAEYLSDTLNRNDEAIQEARAALQIMNYGVGRRILAMALYRKWADMVAQGNEEGGDIYFQEASELYPNLNDVMAYGASVPACELLAKALITKKGVSIDAATDDGSTALLIATNRNREKTVEILLSLNANPNTHDQAGWTPLISAADEGNATIVEMLLDKGANSAATMNGLDAAGMAESRGNGELSARLKKHTALSKPQ